MTTRMNMCDDNATSMEIFYDMVANDMWTSWDNVADYFEYQPWVFSILGSAMVGLSGILPLFVIPIDEGANLKNGAGAKTLKMLLSFAVGGLLGDVFLHLLPEAWANRTLNIKSNTGHPSMVCGLWVLTGFLVFIIAEKIFIDSNEGETDDNNKHEENEKKINSTQKPEMNGFQNNININNNLHTELENNNFLSTNRKVRDAELLSSSKFGELIRNRIGYISNTVSVNSTANNFKTSDYNELYGGKNIECKMLFNLTKAKNNSETERIPSQCDKRVKMPIKTLSNPPPPPQTFVLNKQVISKNSTISQGQNSAKSKHISGYLNLLANCIDNFTHGLAVGGSFLVSFRLGALTTFAILIHEIPHEVGDFAILLKSGFNRWDAARAQLLTASGGIFGALIAVLCSGNGSVESRTSWILPFTAGGFLHIGLVTILPELLKESNPKESIKQLGALLSGITVMAMLTIICD